MKTPRSPELRAKMRAARVAAIPPFTVRFWSKVDKRGHEECWNWKAHVQTRGYGQFHVALVNGKCWRQPAHRIAWTLTNGPIPDGLVIDHICKNTRCCNPAHLRVVTQYANCMELARPTPFFINKTKTHCLRGHPFDTMLRRKGIPHRACTICIKIRKDRAEAKRLAKIESARDSK